MMKWLGVACIWVAAGCMVGPSGRVAAPPLQSEEEFRVDQFVGIYPDGAPVPVEGGFDFDLLGETTGRGCYDRLDNTTLEVRLGRRVFSGGDNEQAEAAAIVDALAKLAAGTTEAPADALLVTRARAWRVDGSAQVCAEVHGRGIRLKQAVVPRLGTKSDRACEGESAVGCGRGPIEPSKMTWSTP
jgi:hypothetical protein